MRLISGIVWIGFFFQMNGQSQALHWNKILTATPALKTVYLDSAQVQLQIIVDVLEPSHDGGRTRFSFRDYPTEYFYPASLVKLPTAIFACERLNEISAQVDMHTPLQILAKAPCQKSLFEDPFTNDCKPTLAAFIRKSLTISDNAAYSRLFEWVTPEYYEKRFAALKLPFAAIRVKFDGCTVDEARCSPSFKFFKDDTLLYSRDEQCYNLPYTPPLPDMRVSNLKKEDKVATLTSKDFSLHNCLPLGDVHELLIALCKPEYTALDLKITQIQREWLISSMQQPPAILHDSWKQDQRFHDHFYNFLVYGNSPQNHINGLKITNIVGLAYGYAAESAMIEDEEGTTIFISAKLYYNYYETKKSGNSSFTAIAMPFMLDLGNEIYRWVKATKK